MATDLDSDLLHQSLPVLLWKNLTQLHAYRTQLFDLLRPQEDIALHILFSMDVAMVAKLLRMHDAQLSRMVLRT